MSKSESLFGEYWRKNLGTHFLLLMVAIIWGSTWAAGRFLSFGQEDSPASLEPATAAWLRYVFAVLVFFMWAISNKKRQGVRFFPPDRVSWKFTIWMGFSSRRMTPVLTGTRPCPRGISKVKRLSAPFTWDLLTSGQGRRSRGHV